LCLGQQSLSPDQFTLEHGHVLLGRVSVVDDQRVALTSGEDTVAIANTTNDGGRGAHSLVLASQPPEHDVAAAQSTPFVAVAWNCLELSPLGARGAAAAAAAGRAATATAATGTATTVSSCCGNSQMIGQLLGLHRALAMTTSDHTPRTVIAAVGIHGIRRHRLSAVATLQRAVAALCLMFKQPAAFPAQSQDRAAARKRTPNVQPGDFGHSKRTEARFAGLLRTTDGARGGFRVPSRQATLAAQVPTLQLGRHTGHVATDGAHQIFVERRREQADIKSLIHRLMDV